MSGLCDMQIEMKDTKPNFKGKVLSVLSVNEDTSQLIANPTFESQVGRVFLIGTVPKDSSQDNWMEGLKVSIAWDSVQDYVIFDSVDDYVTRLHAKDKKKKKKK